MAKQAGRNNSREKVAWAEIRQKSSWRSGDTETQRGWKYGNVNENSDYVQL